MQLPGAVCSVLGSAPQLFREVEQLLEGAVQVQFCEVERAFGAVWLLLWTVEQVVVAVWQLLCRMSVARLILLIKTIAI